jgi:hypothetical protein
VKITAAYHSTTKGRASLERQKPRRAKWHRDWRRAEGRFAYVRRAAIRRGLAWTLTKFEYAMLITGNCAYCGLESDVEAGVGLDRLDNSKGYEQSNVVPCCTLCNVVRGARFTCEEMQILGRAIRQIREERSK